MESCNKHLRSSNIESATRLPPKLLHRTSFLEPGGRQKCSGKTGPKGCTYRPFADDFVFWSTPGQNRKSKNPNKALQTFKTWTKTSTNLKFL
ncbi:hypothetical protein AVEN_152786-1 [Araneus ventricosus]|uniref:Uncharacterized protein n=1 Tax=Araneus ventricosus TaxID=182803 RepID=A0A4Y2V3J4_ARAVE|nr:hypothetical protein AVEN_152786-1 [Araneus ventricosus]